MAVFIDKRGPFPTPKVGPVADDDTFAAMAKYSGRPVAIVLSARPFTQWFALWRMLTASADELKRRGVVVPTTAAGLLN